MYNSVYVYLIVYIKSRVYTDTNDHVRMIMYT